MKALALVLLSLSLAAPALAGEKPVTAKDLPAAARTFLDAQFPTAKITSVMLDRGWGSKTFEVTLDDGTQLDFNGKGEWREIDAPKGASLPEGVVPAAILDYVKRTYPDARVREMSLRGKGYEIELSNGVELRFDPKGQFLRVD